MFSVIRGAYTELTSEKAVTRIIYLQPVNCARLTYLLAKFLLTSPPFIYIYSIHSKADQF